MSSGYYNSNSSFENKFSIKRVFEELKSITSSSVCKMKGINIKQEITSYNEFLQRVNMILVGFFLQIGIFASKIKL